MSDISYSTDHVLVLQVLLYRQEGLDEETINFRYDALNHARLSQVKLETILRELETAELLARRGRLWFPTDACLTRFSKIPIDETDWGPDFLYLCDQLSVPRPF
jgi:hypothetical protein